MKFIWHPFEEQKFKTMQSIVKSGGRFKSEKQAKLISRFWAYERTKEELDELFGIKTDGPAKVVFVSARIRFSELGGRGLRPFELAFVIDDVGVVSVWRLRFKCYDVDRASAPDPTRTEKLWQRG